MTVLVAERFFAVDPELVQGVLADVAAGLFRLEGSAEGSLRYRTRSGVCSPGAVVDVRVVATPGGTLVRAAARVRASMFRRTAWERQRLDLLLAATEEVLAVELPREQTWRAIDLKAETVR